MINDLKSIDVTKGLQKSSRKEGNFLEKRDEKT